MKKVSNSPMRISADDRTTVEPDEVWQKQKSLSAKKREKKALRDKEGEEKKEREAAIQAVEESKREEREAKNKGEREEEEERRNKMREERALQEKKKEKKQLDDMFRLGVDDSLEGIPDTPI